MTRSTDRHTENTPEIALRFRTERNPTNGEGGSIGLLPVCQGQPAGVNKQRE